MIAVLTMVFYFDHRLDRLEICGTVWQTLLLGRTHVPAGLVMWLFFTVLIVLSAGELADIFRAKGFPVARGPMTTGAVGGCGLIYLVPPQSDPQVALAVAATGLVVLLVASLTSHGRRGHAQGAIAVASAAVLGAIYVGVGPAFFLAIRRWYSPWVVVGVIAVVKACDVGAYFVGRAVGRHKLCVWLSPGKTWEGLAGGVLASALTCVALVAVSEYGQQVDWWGGDHDAVGSHGISWWYALWAGAIMGLVGQLGDLVISFFKRDAGIKDAGGTVPGFGGLLDVFDSPMMVAPLAYWLLRLGVVII